MDIFQPKCIQQSRASFICINPKCKKSNPFICQICPLNLCKFQHQKCIIKNLNCFIYEIEYIKIHKNQQIIKLTNRIQQAIRSTIKCLEKQFEYFKQWKNRLIDNKNIRQLYNSIRQNKEGNWNGKKIVEMLSQIENNSDDIKFNQLKFNLDSKLIGNRTQQLRKMIRNTYQTQQETYFIQSCRSLTTISCIQSPFKSSPYLEKIQQTSDILIIKQYYLDKLNKRLNCLDDNPVHLELKV